MSGLDVWTKSDPLALSAYDRKRLVTAADCMYEAIKHIEPRGDALQAPRNEWYAERGAARLRELDALIAAEGGWDAERRRGPGGRPPGSRDNKKRNYTATHKCEYAGCGAVFIARSWNARYCDVHRYPATLEQQHEADVRRGHLKGRKARRPREQRIAAAEAEMRARMAREAQDAA